MDKELFGQFQNELLEEAKRIVPLVYNEKKLSLFNISDYKKYVNRRYNNFMIDIELLLIGLCGMKFDGLDWENKSYDLNKGVEHHKRVLKYDEDEFGANVQETIDNVANEIVNNYDKYKGKSLFDVIPLLVKKYMNSHNDSVEHAAYVLYLNNSLKKLGKFLPTTNLCDLQTI